MRVLCRAGAGAAKSAPPCGGDEIARGTVSRVIDGRTFVLDDGREVRLAAIEVPPLPLPQATRRPAPGGTAAKAALDALAGGDEVVLRRARELPPTVTGASSPMPMRCATARRFSRRAN